MRRRMLKEIEFDPDESLTRRWGTRADDVRVKRTMAALEANGMTVLRASDAAAAKRIVLDLIPDASSVHQGASQTLDVLGITHEIEKSGRYAALRPRIWSMDRETEADEIRRLGAAPDVMLGSVHAVTETGFHERQPARALCQRRRTSHSRRRHAEDRARPRARSPPHQRIRVSARRRPRPGCLWRTQCGEQGSRDQPGDYPGADHRGVGRRGARFLNAKDRSTRDDIRHSNP